MARPKKNEETVENNDVLNNIEALELENKQLKEQIRQKEELIEQTKQSLADAQRKSEQYDAGISRMQEQIDSLKSEKEELQEKFLQSQQDTDDELTAKINTYKERIAELEEKLSASSESEKTKKTELDALRVQFNDFVEQNKKEEEKRKSEEDKRKNDDKNIVRLSPFAEKLLAALCHRLTEKYGKKIKPSQVIEDYLIRYNVQRWSEWFHPFVLSDKEMLAIAQQVNPEIKSVREMRNALNIRNNED